MGDLAVLARRADFVRVAGSGRKWAAPGMVMQAARAPLPPAEGESVSATPSLRVGFTASKKVGGAVVRNRARRRLRAVAREVLLTEATPGYDYVLIARAETATRDYAALRADLRVALKRLKLLQAKAAA